MIALDGCAESERETDSNRPDCVQHQREILVLMPASRCSASNENVCVSSTRGFGIWRPGSRPFADSPLDINRYASLRARRPEDDFARDGLEYVLESARTLLARAYFCSFGAVRMMAITLIKTGIFLLAQTNHTKQSLHRSGA
jgi:hypothetical protein